jgi:hypothetical protein
MRGLIRIGMAAGFVVAGAVAGCGTGEEPYRAPRPVRLSAADAGARAGLMRAIAATYRQWGRADEGVRWAPTLCAPAAPPAVSGGAAAAAKISRAEDAGGAHGHKLFLLYAADRAAYLSASGASAPANAAAATRPGGVTQAVVKEAWRPMEITEAEAAQTPPDRKARRDGKWYKAGESGDLFVMAKVADERAAGTDHGWVYGVVKPGTNEVFDAGVIRRCAECHQQAGGGRLFGVSRGSERTALPWTVNTDPAGAKGLMRG